MELPELDEQSLMSSIDETMAKAFDESEKEPETSEPEAETTADLVADEAGDLEDGETVVDPLPEAAIEVSADPKPIEAEPQPDPRFKAMDDLIAPRRETWAMHGLSETQAINQLLTISDYADRDPAAFIQWFAQQRGVDLKSFDPGPEETDDPTLAPVLAEVRELKTRLTQQDQQAEIQSQHQIAAQIEAFRTEKVDGQPKYPHFETVRPDMAALIAQGRAASMEEAYDRAVWAHPETRAQKLAEQDKAKEAERLAKAKQAANKAAKATAGSPASQGVNVAPSTRSIDDTMAEAYDRAQSA